MAVEAFFDDGHQHIDGDGDPDLSFDGVFRGAEEGLDSQVLFDPFEEQLDLPAAFVEFGNGECRQGEVVGEEYEGVVSFGVVILDAAQVVRVVAEGMAASQHTDLVVTESCRPMDRL